MKTLRELCFAVVLTLLATTAFAGETQGPGAPAPGEVNTPPAAGETQTPPGELQTPPGETHSPPASTAESALLLYLLQTWLLLG